MVFLSVHTYQPKSGSGSKDWPPKSGTHLLQNVSLFFVWLLWYQLVWLQWFYFPPVLALSLRIHRNDNPPLIPFPTPFLSSIFYWKSTHDAIGHERSQQKHCGFDTLLSIFVYFLHIFAMCAYKKLKLEPIVVILHLFISFWHYFLRISFHTVVNNRKISSKKYSHLNNSNTNDII